MRKPLAHVLLLSVLSSAAGCSSMTGSHNWTDSLAFWRSSQDQDEYQPSESFRKAKRELKDPEHTMLAYARYLEDNEQYGPARDTYRDLAAEYPHCIEAELGLARIEAATGRNVQAEQILTKLTDAHPDNVSTWLELGRLYSQQHDWNQAIGAFNRAVEIDPQHETPRYELGLALVEAGKIEDALTHLEFAVGRSAAYYNVGFMLYENGRHHESAVWFERAMQSNPDARTSTLSRKMLTALGQEPMAPAAHPAELLANGAPERPPVILSSSEHHYQEPANAESAAIQEQSTTVAPARYASLTAPVSEDTVRTRTPLTSTADYQTSTHHGAAQPISASGHASMTTTVPDWHRSDAQVLPPVGQQAGTASLPDRQTYDPPAWRSGLNR
ncbi:MAG: tetratricopeptide repeat protein [Planctomycetaceae bacterium]|nr:tetratricopeptide repeat protein [Planctomycetaceae bacterium]